MRISLNSTGHDPMTVERANRVKKESVNNPSLQCVICGKWKRLNGVDGKGHYVQRFFSGCSYREGREEEHKDDTCQECCDRVHGKKDNTKTTMVFWILYRLVP